MKWSEQMRELLSVDENFNQLEFDIVDECLKINREFLANAQLINTQYIIDYSDYLKIIEKYPCFTDIKLLLNCIFKDNYYIAKTEKIEYSGVYFILYPCHFNYTLLIKTEYSD